MTKPKVAFVCVHNSCRSQIAEALGKGIVIEVRERYREVWECGDYTYAMLMDDIYNEHGGTGNLTDMWKDYSDVINADTNN